VAPARDLWETRVIFDRLGSALGRGQMVLVNVAEGEKGREGDKRKIGVKRASSDKNKREEKKRRN